MHLLRMVISVTKQCNLRCRHCYASAGATTVSGELTTSEWKQVLHQGRRLGLRLLVVSGGEPLMQFEKTTTIISYAKNMGLRVGLTTNGTLLDEEKASDLLEVGLDTLQISVDGAYPSTHEFLRGRGTYDLAIRAIQIGIRTGLHTTVLMVAGQHNADEVYELGRRAQGWGVKTLGVDRFLPAGRGKTHRHLAPTPDDLRSIFSQLIKLEEEHRLSIHCNDPIYGAYRLHRKGITRLPPQEDSWGGCTAGTESCYIDAAGTVYPCTMLPIPVGSVPGQSLESIWVSDATLKQLRSKDILCGLCGTCPYRKACGGCRAVPYALYGEMLGDDPFCFLSRDMERDRNA